MIYDYDGNNRSLLRYLSCLKFDPRLRIRGMKSPRRCARHSLYYLPITSVITDIADQRIEKSIYVSYEITRNIIVCLYRAFFSIYIFSCFASEKSDMRIGVRALANF